MGTNLGDPALHFFMTRSVARVMGINLGDALRTGQLSPETYANMVTRCRGCPLVGQCQTWLGNAQAHNGCPPEQCLNAQEFASLRVH